MSVESAWLAQARPQIQASRIDRLLRQEIVKGCTPDVAMQPQALEPPYQPLTSVVQGFVDDHGLLSTVDNWVTSAELVRLRLWVSPEQACDWRRSERFLKQISSELPRRVLFELAGNADGIFMSLGCHRDDVAVVQTTFTGEFERCRLTPVRAGPLAVVSPAAWHSLVLRDYYPSPPYTHLFTRPDELRRSPYGTIFAALATIPREALGLYQILFQPVAPDHDWHHHVEKLLDLEFALKLNFPGQSVQRNAQQLPSGDLRHMAAATETKAHNDKPFFAAALRVAVLGSPEAAPSALRSLSAFAGLIQHGGRPLNWVSDADYRLLLDTPSLRDMILLGHTYRQGFLVNSLELTSLVHVPDASVTEYRAAPVATLETLPSDASLFAGTRIGTCDYAGELQAVCIPEDARGRHTHLIGAPGQGKSSCIQNMVLQDIDRGCGVAVIDPHGALVQSLLPLIPIRHGNRVIYLNPGDPQSVPIWNPLRCGAGQDPGRVAADLVGAFRGFVQGWGDRLEHVLRQAIHGALHLPDGTLFDVYNLLRKGSDESERLRQRMLKLVDHRVTQLFLRTDLPKYATGDLTPAQHKLSKLLSVETVCHMLAQPRSAFDIRDIMDSGKILLLDLSSVGTDAADTLGCFMLSLLRLAALSRSDTDPSRYLPFHIYCDEAHRFLTTALEELIAETRKFKVSLTLAHQYLAQLDQSQIGAVCNVGSTIIFRVDSADAGYLKRSLQGRAEVDDLTTLERRHAVVRIDNHVVRMETIPVPEPAEPNGRDQIVEQSRQRYCQSLAELKRLGQARWEPPPPITLPTNVPEGAQSTEELAYEEL